jgi:hypothetical protein
MRRRKSEPTISNARLAIRPPAIEGRTFHFDYGNAGVGRDVDIRERRGEEVGKVGEGEMIFLGEGNQFKAQTLF